jgi:hypothetical protein
MHDQVADAGNNLFQQTPGASASAILDMGSLKA